MSRFHFPLFFQKPNTKDKFYSPSALDSMEIREMPTSTYYIAIYLDFQSLIRFRNSKFLKVEA